MNPQHALELVRQRERELQQRAERDRLAREAGKATTASAGKRRGGVVRLVLRPLRWSRG